MQVMQKRTERAFCQLFKCMQLTIYTVQLREINWDKYIVYKFLGMNTILSTVSGLREALRHENMFQRH